MRKHFILMSALVAILFVTACKDSKKSSDGPKFLVQATSLGTLTPQQIHQIYNDPVVNVIAFQQIEAFRITYRTQNVSGGETQASGLVIVPAIPGGSLFSLHRGTTFLKAEAPSNFSISDVNSNAGWAYFAPPIASSGYVVVMPDLLGYGASNSLNHPFFITSSDGTVALDLLRATTEFLELREYVTSGKLFISGYSQGGTTTLALVRAIQAEASSEFNITAAAAGGGAYDLMDVSKTILSKDDLGFAPYFGLFVKSFIENYFPERAYNTIFKEPYATRIVQENLFSGEVPSSTIADRLTNVTADLFREDFIEAFLGDGEVELKQRIEENNLTNFVVNNRIRIYHGVDDEIIPVETAQRAAAMLNEQGAVNLSFISVDGSHGGAALPIGLATLSWFSNY